MLFVCALCLVSNFCFISSTLVNVDLVYDWIGQFDSLLSPSPHKEFLALFAWFTPLRTEGNSTDTSAADSLAGAKREFESLKADFNANPSKYMGKLDLNIFRSLINGLFQAEGTLGVYFQPKALSKGTISLYSHFAIGQNYSFEAALLLLQLQHVLEGIGYFKFELTSSGSLHIKFIVYSTTDILTVVIPYLNEVYGQKAWSVQVFPIIHQIAATLCGCWDSTKATLLVYLVYSLNPEGNDRKLTLGDLLNKLGLSFPASAPELPTFIENNKLPSIAFILGFFLGDGSLGITLDDPKARYPMFYVKLFFELIQMTSKHTLHMFSLFSQTLSIYFKVSISSGVGGMTRLSVAGLRVATHVLPVLSQFSNLLYWKKGQFFLASEVSTLLLNKSHLTREGLLKIVHLLYSSPVNSRKEPIEHWLKLIGEAFPAGSKPRRGAKR